MGSQSSSEKARILIVGTGGIGTVSAYSLEKGGKAEVTAVMRSNYAAAVKNGIDIDSVQYGQIKGWNPTASMFSPTHDNRSPLTSLPQL